MLSKVIKNKIESRYNQQIKYAKQCDALAAHISECCHCKISSSTIKRLWGFIKKESAETEARPREWTLDILSNYIGYKNWSDLQNELAGNKDKKKERIESIDCVLLKPSTTVVLKFGRVAFIQMRLEIKGRFIVTAQNKSTLNINDELEIEKITLNLPVLVKKLKRNGTTTNNVIIGDITGVTEITTDDESPNKSKRQSNGILTSKI